MIPKRIISELEKKQYSLVSHAGVQICSWNKKALQGRGVCYKQKFYNVHTHKCMQFSPAAIWCPNQCIYCWRPVELMNLNEFGEYLPPEKLIPPLIEARRRLLSGFGGREGMNLELWKDSLVPDHYAISLSGEPTIYPELPKMIKLIRQDYKARSIFLVTNGTIPTMIQRLKKEDGLPDQLYVSVVAPTKQLYKKIARPRIPDAWGRFQKSLGLLKDIGTRTVLRLTIIKGINEKFMNKFAELIEQTAADFVEVKAYMFLGYSRHRLKIENMPRHHEIQKYSKELEKHLENYAIVDEHAPSRIVLIKNQKSKKKKELCPFEEAD